MTRILFIYPKRASVSFGIECLSAYLKSNGHHADLILYDENNFRERLIKRLKMYEPDFIGFSVMTEDYGWAKKIGKLTRSLTNIPIIFGGNHPTGCPEEVIKNSFVDYLVRSEGEEPLIEIIENPKRNNIKNTWIKRKNKIYKNNLRPLIQDLDSLPLPDKTLFNKEGKHYKELYNCMVGRGCPFGCSYCFNNYMKKLHLNERWSRKKRSPINVISELKLAKKYGAKVIYFIDDVFTSDKKWLNEFLNKYKKEINIPFKILGHVLFTNDEICKMLKDAGCIEVEFGIQTPFESIRTKICKRAETNKQVIKSVKCLKKNKIVFSVSHIFGLPYEEKESWEKGLNFYIDIKPNKIADFWLQYYPNTEIVDIGLAHGDLKKQHLKDVINGNITFSMVGNQRKKNKDLLSLSIFFQWITILPRPLSRFLAKNKKYRKIFYSEKVKNIPRILRHFTSLKLFIIMIMAIKRKIEIEYNPQISSITHHEKELGK